MAVSKKSRVGKAKTKSGKQKDRFKKPNKKQDKKKPLKKPSKKLSAHIVKKDNKKKLPEVTVAKETKKGSLKAGGKTATKILKATGDHALAKTRAENESLKAAANKSAVVKNKSAVRKLQVDRAVRTSALKISEASLAEAVCREVACENLATTGGYCRMHYIKNWKKIKRKELILKERKLNQYIEELVAKYPDKYIEAIRQDLANDKDFAKVIHDLDLDESIDDYELDSESVDNLIDNIKRDFEDEGEGF